MGTLMKSKHRKPEQILRHLRDIDALISTGQTVESACRQLNLSVPTYYGWRKKYGDMSSDELARLKTVELENQRLKRAVADLTLDNQILKEAAEGNF